MNLVKASSIDNDMPRTNKQLPNPFHNVVTPCRWCKCTIIGTNVTGTRWYLMMKKNKIWNRSSSLKKMTATHNTHLLELLWTWHCLRSTTNGWLNKFSVIKLTIPTLTPIYFRIEISSGLSENGWTVLCFCSGSTKSRSELTYWYRCWCCCCCSK